MTPLPLIIDTDPGIDDALAIFYALASGRFELCGLTTIFGNVTVDTATVNALWLMEACGRPDVPVARGAPAPLAERVHSPSAHVHGAHGFGALPPRQARGMPQALDAADFLIAQSLARPGQLHVAAIGPLTNLAIAVQRDPGFAERIACLHVMGGAFEAPGNVTPHAEANIWNDPLAAQIVAQAYPRLSFIGLDVTDQIPLTAQNCARLAAANADWAPFIDEISRYYLDFYAAEGRTEGAGLHDPVTLISIVAPQLFRFATGAIAVDQAGAAAGRTRLTPGRSGRRVALAGEFDALRALFLDEVEAWLAAGARA